MKIWLFLLIGLAINNALAEDIQSCQNQRNECNMMPCSMSLDAVKACRVGCIKNHIACLKRIQNNDKSILDLIKVEIKNQESSLQQTNDEIIY